MTQCFVGKPCRSVYSSKLLVLFLLSCFLGIPNRAHALDITLAWNPNQEAHLAGYRLFHRVEGQPYDYDAPVAEVTQTTCTVAVLNDQSTCFFVVKAFGTDGSVSGDSNEVVYQPVQDPPSESTEDFQQDSGTQGLVSMEAENRHGGVAQGSHEWRLVSAPSGFSGAGAMQALPEDYVNKSTGYTTTSPRMDFDVNFARTGAHYVWLRTFSPSSSSNSFHAGLDGQAIASAANVNCPVSTGYGWAGGTATLNISSGGTHTVNVWMRESGTVVDKVVLTVDPNFVPTGVGPAESPRGGSQIDNQAPVLSPVGNRAVNEGQLLEFTVNGSDADGDSLTYSAGGLPAGAAFNTSTRMFTWQPDFNASGSYVVSFTVSDNGAPAKSDSEAVTIQVSNVNQAPVLNAIGAKTVNEGGSLSFTVSGGDADGDSLTYSASGLPAGASFGALTRTFTWQPGFNASGSYMVTFTVSDNGTPAKSDSEAVTIQVGNVNQAPVLNAIGTKAVNEGGSLSFTVSASDADGDSLTYSASGLPAGASFGTLTRTFNWEPGLNTSGVYVVTFTVSDNGAPSKSDSEAVTIQVGNVNQAPVLNAIGVKTVKEGTALGFTLAASDPDGNRLAYAASGLPAGASVNASTGSFSWTPGFSAAGSYAVTFSVSDDGTPVKSDSEQVSIQVSNVNQPPVLSAIGSKAVAQGELLKFTITATDADNDRLLYGANGLPAGASFDASTGTFSWIPGDKAAGEYSVTFTVTDNGQPVLTDSETVSIVVGDLLARPLAPRNLVLEVRP